jgi:serine/threonine protein kinase
VRHENVITIHAVREANGLPYFVMEYVAGGSLQDYLDRRPAPDWRTVARLGVEIAAGLAAAHAKGLIHRDIKPSNILLQSEEEETKEPGVAKISDFGLAHIADESRLTQTGLIAGTPMYMAPEQVQGEALDHRADLFGLGSVLYVLCTGREPFPGSGPMAVIRQVCVGEPTPIREVNPAIPDWLAAVVERLHAKRREDRFASAAEVADLLRYNLEHPDQPRCPPSVARQQSAANGQRRTNSRRRRVMALVAVFLLLGSLALAAALYQTYRGEQQSDLPVRATLQGHSGPILSVAFSPDGQTLATGSDDTTLRLWDAATGQENTTLSGHNSAIFAVAFAHSGRFLLGNSGDGTLHFWDTATWKEQPPLAHQNSNARRVVLSPDDRTAALSNKTQGVDLWDLDSRQIRRSLPGDQGSIMSLVFSVDGETLATGDARGRIHLWEPATGTERAAFRGDPVGLRALTFAPDGRTLASVGTGDGNVKLWDAASHRQTVTLSGRANFPLSLAFSPDGSLLATGTRLGTVLIWDVASTRTLVVLPAHQGAIWALAFSPDGRTLATGGEDHLGKLWDVSGLLDARP